MTSLLFLQMYIFKQFPSTPLSGRTVYKFWARAIRIKKSTRSKAYLRLASKSLPANYRLSSNKCYGHRM